MPQNTYFIRILLLIVIFTISQNYSQTLEGSFESKFKRYVKGEVFKGKKSDTTKLVGWKGERLYTQIVLWSNTNEEGISYDVSRLIDGKNSIGSDQITLMFAKNVKADPLAQSCGTYPHPRLEQVEVADALSFDPTDIISKNDPLKVWVRIDLPSDASPGNYKSSINVKKGTSQILTFNLEIEVLNKTLPKVKDWQFHLDLWQYPYQILKYYNKNHPERKIQLWSGTHYEMYQPFYELLADAGQKVISTQIKDGAQGQPSMIRWIKKEDGTWSYDFTSFDKFVFVMSQLLGISKQINCFSPAGWDNIRDYIPYFDETTKSKKKLHAPLGSNLYIERWNHFLTAFKVHLKDKGWFEKTVLYLDEVPEKSLKTIVDFIHKHDPNWKIGLTYFKALTPEIKNAIYDLSGLLGEATGSNSENKVETFYTSCNQTIPNSYVTPQNSPSEMSWMAFFAENQNLDGYLRWAYDYWTLNDPLDIRNGGHTSGDYAFVYRDSNNLDSKVYSSYRLELLRNGIQGFEKIQILKKELKKDTSTNSQVALKRLNKKIKQFNRYSGYGAEVLVEETEQLLNQLAKGNYPFYCNVSGGNEPTAYTRWISVVGSRTELGNTWMGSYDDYLFYEAGEISAKPGSTFTLTIENTLDAACAKTALWIDWNGDMDFDDSGEAVWQGGTVDSCSNPTTYKPQIKIPLTAKKGNTRIRIQVRDSKESNPMACGEITKSATRDLKLNITDNYCTPKTDFNNRYFVRKLTTDACGGNVLFENSVASIDGYLHYENQVVKAERGATFNLNFENSIASNCARTTVWLDWNQDGDFNDENEKVNVMGKADSCYNRTQYALLIHVPKNALLGKTRMRIQLRDAYQEGSNSCSRDQSTGTTDFTVQIIDKGNSDCSPLLLYPNNEDQLTETTQIFKWKSNNNEISQWKLKISNANQSLNQIYFEKSFDGNTTSVIVEGLPEQREKLLTELFWLKNGTWYSNVYNHLARDIYCNASSIFHNSYFVQTLKTTGTTKNITYQSKRAPNKGYFYYDTDEIIASAGHFFSMEITASPAANCARTKVWIDWNEDGDFDDNQEEITSIGSAESCENAITYKVTVQVPSNTTSGTKRIRIGLRDSWHGEPLPCGEINHTGILDLNLKTESKFSLITESNSRSKIAPNPNRGVFNIMLDSGFKIGAQLFISVYSISGNLLFQMQETNYNNEVKINASELSNNIFIVSIQDNNGNKFNSKISILR